MELHSTEPLETGFFHSGNYFDIHQQYIPFHLLTGYMPFDGHQHSLLLGIFSGVEWLDQIFFHVEL